MVSARPWFYSLSLGSVIFLLHFSLHLEVSFLGKREILHFGYWVPLIAGMAGYENSYIKIRRGFSPRSMFSPPIEVLNINIGSEWDLGSNFAGNIFDRNAPLCGG